jgi:uncharacterized protein (TIGR04255 family)
MSFNFPDVEEVTLENSPLGEVICQVKYPIILAINEQKPIQFQDKIRGRFPELHIDDGGFVQVDAEFIKSAQMVKNESRVYRFNSPEAKTSVALAQDFFALSTRGYTHWHEFKDDLALIYKAMVNIYQIPYATRVGLRFINLITLENTGCKNLEEMFGLFKQELVCLLQSKEISGFSEAIVQLLIPDEEKQLAIRFILNHNENKPFFILDFDYYDDRKTDISSLPEEIDQFHLKIYRAFRWCLLEKSLERFQHN